MKKTFLLFLVAAVAVRITTFLVSSTFGADSISRILISVDWAQNPFFIWHPNNLTSVWLPLQFYINGLVLMVWNNPQLAPRIVSLLASLASIIVFYRFARHLFDHRAASLATVFFALYAMHIKHGNIAGSESLYILTVLLSAWAYHSFLKYKSWRLLLALILSLVAGTMIRFEAWLLPSFITLFLLAKTVSAAPRPKRRLLVGALAVALFSSVFMVLWMYGSWREYGHIFYSVQAATAEHVDLTGQTVSRWGNWGMTLYNAGFWPGVLLISLSPLVLLAGIWGIIQALRRRLGLEWIFFFALQSTVYLYQSVINNSLAPLARYTIFPGAMICLFSGFGAIDLIRRFRKTGSITPMVRIAATFTLAWVLLLCFDFHNHDNPLIRKLSSVSPVTQYPPSGKPVIQWLKNNLQPGQTVMFNTPGFASNAIILYAGLSPEQYVKVSETETDKVLRQLHTAGPTYLILHKTGPLQSDQGYATLRDSILLPGIILRLDRSIGDYGLYIPEFDHPVDSLSQ